MRLFHFIYISNFNKIYFFTSLGCYVLNQIMRVWLWCFRIYTSLNVDIYICLKIWFIGPFRHKFLRMLLPFWSSALPTLPVTAPPRKDGIFDEVQEGRPRHQRSSRMDPRKILLTIALMYYAYFIIYILVAKWLSINMISLLSWYMIFLCSGHAWPQWAFYTIDWLNVALVKIYQKMNHNNEKICSACYTINISNYR